MTVKIKVKLDELKGRDLIAMEENGGSVVFLRAMLVRFMVDENGQRIDPEKALAIFDEMSATEIRELGKKFLVELKRAMNEAVDPLAEGGS